MQLVMDATRVVVTLVSQKLEKSHCGPTGEQFKN